VVHREQAAVGVHFDADAEPLGGPQVAAGQGRKAGADVIEPCGEIEEVRPAWGGVDLGVGSDGLPFPAAGVGTDHDPDSPQGCEVVNDTVDDVRVEMGPDETPETP